MEDNIVQSLTAQTNTNIAKTWVLMGVFLAGITVLGFFVSQVTGNVSFLYGAFGLSLMMNVYAYYNSAAIALRSAGAVPANKDIYKELYATVAALAQKMQIPMPQLYIVEDDAPNAFATGRSPSNAHVAVTTGILHRLTPDELEGVLAHELSHVSNRDILVMTVAVVLVGALSMLANVALRASSYNSSRDGQGSNAFIIVATVLAAILAPIAAQLLQLAVSRRREYLADSTGALVTGEPKNLAKALEKIGAYAAPMQRASYTTAHLFISNPFGHARMGAFLSGLFSTHPPIAERVRILRGE